MVDPESVRRRLREIDRRLGALRTITAQGEDSFFAAQSLQAEAERHLQLVIQSSIDIAVHIVAEDSAQTPEDYGAAFTMLGEMGVIEGDLAQRLRSAAGLRNILVHAYLELDPHRVWEHLSRLDDFVHLADAVERYLGS